MSGAISTRLRTCWRASADLDQKRLQPGDGRFDLVALDDASDTGGRAGEDEIARTDFDKLRKIMNDLGNPQIMSARSASWRNSSFTLHWTLPLAMTPVYISGYDAIASGGTLGVIYLPNQ